MSSPCRIALVTGGSRGLGRSIALSLARRLVSSVITYRSDQAAAEEVAAAVRANGIPAAVLQLDTSETSGFEAFTMNLRSVLRDNWGRESLDFLVNNAGFGVSSSIATTREEDFDRLMRVHLKGVFFLAQRLLPVIADGRRVINISSGLTRFTGPGMAAYAMMKAGIETFTRYLAQELGPRGITVNTVAPGAIETDFGGGAVRDNPEYNRRIASVTALGRAGMPDDIGPMVAALLSDDNRWVNGQRIEASGGMNL